MIFQDRERQGFAQLAAFFFLIRNVLARQVLTKSLCALKDVNMNLNLQATPNSSTLR